MSFIADFISVDPHPEASLWDDLARQLFSRARGVL